MKTVILCGGKGTRLSEETEFKPKPLVEIGGEPILLHVMKHYAQHDFKEFILCLGYKGSMIRDYFANHSWHHDDYEINLARDQKTYLRRENDLDYSIILADTGENTNTAGRVKRILHHISDEHFMVTYGDGVGTVDINALIQFHLDQEAKYGIVGTITGVHPSTGYGKISFDDNDIIQTFSEKPILMDYINGGFMVFNRSKLAPYLKDEEMLEETLQQLTLDHKLSCFRHDGFWHSMDNMKDVSTLNHLWATSRPWEVKKAK